MHNGEKLSRQIADIYYSSPCLGGSVTRLGTTLRSSSHSNQRVVSSSPGKVDSADLCLNK